MKDSNRKDKTQIFLFQWNNIHATVKQVGGQVQMWGCVSSKGVGKIQGKESKIPIFEHLKIK